MTGTKFVTRIRTYRYAKLVVWTSSTSHKQQNRHLRFHFWNWTHYIDYAYFTSTVGQNVFLYAFLFLITFLLSPLDRSCSQHYTECIKHSKVLCVFCLAQVKMFQTMPISPRPTLLTHVLLAMKLQIACNYLLSLMEVLYLDWL